MTLLLAACLIMCAQNSGNDPAAIRQQMADVRKNTDWNNPDAAKAANKKIEELSVKLTQAIRSANATAQTPPAGTGTGEENQEVTDPVSRITKEVDDYNNQLWNQMMKVFREHGEWDLAEPLREEIAEAYLEDESPKNINQNVLNETTLLVLDMTIPTIQRTIDVMENFRAIETLVITGGNQGVPVNLGDILHKASAYPLKTLYIINFRSYVTDIPDEINQFSNLRTLGIFNNNLAGLPDMSGFSQNLDSLYLDLNPIPSLLPELGSFTGLKKLGIANTSVTEAEIREIERLLPQCTILSK